MMPRIRCALFGCATSVGLTLAWSAFAPVQSARAAGISDQAVAQMSMEELLATEITSAGRHAQPLSSVSAAVYVLSGEEIRRAGKRTLADALRLVPGMQVAAIDANRRAVGARGFNSLYSKHLLVMIDGRTVYTDIFSGVYWEVEDVPVEDVERIEVVRGPGGSLWGANAVNGVINIITKSARETDETLVQAGGGSEERRFATFRSGDVRDHSAWRVSGKFAEKASSEYPGEADYRDDGKLGRASFRFERWSDPSHVLTLQGGAYEGLQRFGVSFFQPVEPYATTRSVDNRVAGGFVLGHWTQPVGDGGTYVAQAFVNVDRHRNPQNWMKSAVCDVDTQLRLPAGRSVALLTGLGYRVSTYDIPPTENVSAVPERDTDHLAGGFLAMEWSPFDAALRVTAGSKFEQSDRAGFQVQPTLRAIWSIRQRQALWGAVSRAARAPSVFDQAGRFAVLALGPETAKNPGPLPVIGRLIGTPEFKPESMVAYELGYRVQPHAHWSLDATAFQCEYHDLLSAGVGTPEVRLGARPYVDLPLNFNNDAKSSNRGFELAVDWLPSAAFRLRSGYTTLHLEYELGGSGAYDAGGFPLASDFAPAQQLFSHASWDLAPRVQLDGVLRLMDAHNRPAARTYTQLDLRVAYLPQPNLELALAGENLLHAAQVETVSETESFVSAVQRGVYSSVTWRF